MLYMFLINDKIIFEDLTYLNKKKHSFEDYTVILKCLLFYIICFIVTVTTAVPIGI
jgi:hypothetical protein